jgi:hypothetical protein
MKKRILHTLLFSLLLTNLHAETVEFGSFYEFENGKFKGWDIGPKADDAGSNAVGTISQSTDGFQSDGQSASFAFKGPGEFRLHYVKRIDINPGQKYRIGISTKTTGGVVTVQGNLIMIPNVGADGKRSPVRSIPFTADAKGEWKTSTCEVTAGEEEFKLGISFTLRNGSAAAETVLVDAMTVEEAP